ncbi:MAG: TetR/AcrR family transcriptional regulator [Bacteroidota bacterium]
MADPSSDTRKRILDVTIKLSSESGFAGVSIRKIARGVGIKESSLYNHFQSKEALLNAALDEAEREFCSLTLPSDAIEGMISGNRPEEFLRKGLNRYKGHWNDPRMSRVWILMEMEQYRSERVASIILRETDRIIRFNETVFKMMIERGLVKPFNARFLAELFSRTMLSLHGDYALSILHKRPPDEIEQRMVAWIRHFVDLISR